MDMQQGLKEATRERISAVLVSWRRDLQFLEAAMLDSMDGGMERDASTRRIDEARGSS